MDCAIWLNRRKLFSADEISANFDIAAIRGYFLGGSLIKWLDSHGGEEYARLLKKLSPSDPALNDRLTEIFTQKKCSVPVHKADEQLIMTINLLKGGSPVTTGSAQAVSSGSYTAGSYTSGSFAPVGLGSFGTGSAGYMPSYGSFRSGSFTGSFSRSWEWEWEWYLGSFRRNYGSFAYSFGSYRQSYGSFGYAFGSYAFGYGSFGHGSFMGGSLSRGLSLGSFPFDMSYGMGSYRGFPLGGSFRQVTADEYDEIMYRCLNICPLNRFGYGIHLI